MARGSIIFGELGLNPVGVPGDGFPKAWVVKDLPFSLIENLDLPDSPGDFGGIFVFSSGKVEISRAESVL
jgi:hypothetical protein